MMKTKNLGMTIGSILIILLLMPLGHALMIIMEHTLEDLMYEIPSDEDIIACTITRDAVEFTGAPEIERKGA